MKEQIITVPTAEVIAKKDLPHPVFTTKSKRIVTTFMYATTANGDLSTLTEHLYRRTSVQVMM